MELLTEIRRAGLSLPYRQWSAQLSAMVAIVTVAAVVWGTHHVRSSRQPDVMLLYVGAEDCAPCRVWRNGEGAAFLASAESRRITYREVKSLRLEDVLKDENWPEDIRGLRNGINQSDGVPLWLIVSDREVVEHQFGAGAWKQRVLPTIRSYLR